MQDRRNARFSEFQGFKVIIRGCKRGNAQISTSRFESLGHKCKFPARAFTLKLAPKRKGVPFSTPFSPLPSLRFTSTCWFSDGRRNDRRRRSGRHRWNGLLHRLGVHHRRRSGHRHSGHVHLRRNSARYAIRRSSALIHRSWERLVSHHSSARCIRLVSCLRTKAHARSADACRVADETMIPARSRPNSHVGCWNSAPYDSSSRPNCYLRSPRIHAMAA